MDEVVTYINEKSLLKCRQIKRREEKRRRITKGLIYVFQKGESFLW